MTKHPAIYILTNQPRGFMYCGVTRNLPRRIWVHKYRVLGGTGAKHKLTQLVYFELIDDITQAICRQQQIKKAPRTETIRLIEQHNPQWLDLYSNIVD
ncbi:MAG: putative endonuclease [Paraglaciecola psychrophila]|jgi:putative endonuclease